ncbi:MAG TPA: glycosyltransferase family 4 protein [Gemmatimonadaceae bacterium]
MTQVSFHCDAERRDAETLLRVWPTLPRVAIAAARAGVDVTVVQGAARRQTVVRDGVAFHFVDDARAMPARLPGGLRVVRRPDRLIASVAALAPDVVHVHGFQYPLAVRQLARSLPGVPVLVQDHASRPPDGWRRHAWRWALRPLAGAAFTARAQAEPFVAAGVLRATLPLFEVLEGSSTFTPGHREAARRESGIGGDPCLLWTAHLDAITDPLTALAAFELAAPRLPDARLWCCFGSAPLLREVQQRIAGSPVLRARVTLLGARPHGAMEPLFRAADFLVQASHREGSGYSVLEALACGATPLVTDIPSLRRIVGDAGSLTPVGDAGALAGAMVAWAGRDRGALRRAARERFRRHLAFDVIGRELRDAYETLARSR